jgi:hypothetical protein
MRPIAAIDVRRHRATPNDTPVSSPLVQEARMTDDDRDTLEGVTQGICEAFSTVLARGWRVSPHATILAAARALAQLALVHLGTHPEQRAAILSTLRDVANAVEAETAVRH